MVRHCPQTRRFNFPRWSGFQLKKKRKRNIPNGKVNRKQQGILEIGWVPERFLSHRATISVSSISSQKSGIRHRRSFPSARTLFHSPATDEPHSHSRPGTERTKKKKTEIVDIGPHVTKTRSGKKAGELNMRMHLLTHNHISERRGIRMLGTRESPRTPSTVSDGFI